MSRKGLFLLSLALTAASLAAQTANPSALFDKAPPDVEAALRERASAFYQVHVDGRFREADAFVCADTKEFYYTARKSRYMSFAIDSIEWQEQYSKAKLTMLLEQRVNFPGFNGQAVKVPTPSTWKVDGGTWCWWVENQDSHATPFGVMRSGTIKDGEAPSQPVDIAGVQQGVKLDKQSLTVTRDLTPATASVLNAMQGAVSLSLDAPSLPGVEIILDRSELKAGESATLRIRANTKAVPKVFEVRILVGPLNTALPVQVTIQS